MRAPDLRHRCPFVRQLPGLEQWELEPRGLAYHDRARDVVITIEGGFVFNFASVPRVFWTSAGHPMSGGTCAPGVHDYLYGHGGVIPGCAHRYSRAEADALLREIMRAHGCSRRKAYTWWLGVRLGGRGAWKGRG